MNTTTMNQKIFGELLAEKKSNVDFLREQTLYFWVLFLQ